MASVGLSITCAAVSEAGAFGLGALTSMPAVQAFAVYSAVAIIADLFLQVMPWSPASSGERPQMTVFAALIVLDYRRESTTRLDCFPCFVVHVPRRKSSVRYSDGLSPSVTRLTGTQRFMEQVFSRAAAPRTQTRRALRRVCWSPFSRTSCPRSCSALLSNWRWYAACRPPFLMA